MRTTLRIDDALLTEVKLQAARSGRTIGEVVEDALRLALGRRHEAASAREELPVFGGSGTLSGIDLGDSAALREVMDESVPLDALR